MSLHQNIFFHKILPFSCHAWCRFQNSFKQALSMGLMCFSITPVYSAEWAITAAGSLFSAPVTRMVSSAYSVTSTFIVDQITIPKADENTLYIHVNSLESDRIRQLCTDKISGYNLEIFRLTETHKHNLEAINFDLGNKQQLINQWIKNYIFISYTVQKVLDFREIYKETCDYIDVLKEESSKGRSSLSLDLKLKLDQQYSNHLSYLKERLITIGALLNAHFPYEGQGGLWDRSKSSADRKKNRHKLWGVQRFGATDHQKKIDQRDDNTIHVVSELDHKLNIFRDFYRQTQDVISQPIDAIINRIYPEGIDLEVVYSQLGLTEQGMKRMPVLSSSPILIPLHSKGYSNSSDKASYGSSPSFTPPESFPVILTSLGNEAAETSDEEEETQQEKDD